MHVSPPSEELYIFESEIPLVLFSSNMFCFARKYVLLAEEYVLIVFEICFVAQKLCFKYEIIVSEYALNNTIKCSKIFKHII